jgi:hypothetical protein
MSERRILITGASSGIGEALAVHYAERHGAGLTLGLVARRGERLEALAARLAPLGARVLPYGADVREREAMAQVARDFLAAAGGVDVAIANAGIGGSDRLRHGDAAAAGDIVNANVLGVIHTLVPLIPAMMEQRAGHLVSVGSIAGFVSIPGKGAYCASKAAVKVLMDAWRGQLRRQGIRVTTVCPGWVVSELTAQNPYPMPFMLDTPRAARLIVRAIERGRATYVLPWQMRLLVPLLRAMPPRVFATFGGRA